MTEDTLSKETVTNDAHENVTNDVNDDAEIATSTATTSLPPRATIPGLEALIAADAPTMPVADQLASNITEEPDMMDKIHDSTAASSFTVSGAIGQEHMPTGTEDESKVQGEETAGAPDDNKLEPIQEALPATKPVFGPAPPPTTDDVAVGQQTKKTKIITRPFKQDEDFLAAARANKDDPNAEFQYDSSDDEAAATNPTFQQPIEITDSESSDSDSDSSSDDDEPATSTLDKTVAEELPQSVDNTDANHATAKNSEAAATDGDANPTTTESGQPTIYPAEESDDDSDTSSSSSSDDSDSSSDALKMTEAEQLKMLFADDIDEDSKGIGGNNGLKTANESDAPIVKITTPITPQMNLIPIGVFGHFVENQLVVTCGKTDDVKVLEPGSALCLEDRTLLGAIDDALGPTDQPFYTVRYESEEEAAKLNLVPGKTKIFCVEELSKWAIIGELRKQKYTDASNAFDEEVGDEDKDFSDDEEEAAHKKRLKEKSRNAHDGLKSDPSNNNNTTVLTLDYDGGDGDDGGDGGYNKLPRPTDPKGPAGPPKPRNRGKNHRRPREPRVGSTSDYPTEQPRAPINAHGMAEPNYVRSGGYKRPSDDEDDNAGGPRRRRPGPAQPTSTFQAAQASQPAAGNLGLNFAPHAGGSYPNSYQSNTGGHDNQSQPRGGFQDNSNRGSNQDGNSGVNNNSIYRGGNPNRGRGRGRRGGFNYQRNSADQGQPGGNNNPVGQSYVQNPYSGPGSAGGGSGAQSPQPQNNNYGGQLNRGPQSTFTNPNALAGQANYGGNPSYGANSAYGANPAYGVNPAYSSNLGFAGNAAYGNAPGNAFVSTPNSAGPVGGYINPTTHVGQPNNFQQHYQGSGNNGYGQGFQPYGQGKASNRPGHGQDFNQYGYGQGNYQQNVTGAGGTPVGQHGPSVATAGQAGLQQAAYPGSSGQSALLNFSQARFQQMQVQLSANGGFAGGAGVVGNTGNVGHAGNIGHDGYGGNVGNAGTVGYAGNVGHNGFGSVGYVGNDGNVDHTGYANTVWRNRTLGSAHTTGSAGKTGNADTTGTGSAGGSQN